MRMDKPISPLKRLSSWNFAHRGFQASLELSRDSGEHCEARGLHGRVLSHGMAALREPLLSGGRYAPGRDFSPSPCRILLVRPRFMAGLFLQGSPLVVPI